MLVAHKKEITARFTVTSVAFFSLQDINFKSCEDLKVIVLLVLCFKLCFGFVFSISHTAIRQCGIHIKLSRKLFAFEL